MTMDQVLLVAECMGAFEEEKMKAITGQPTGRQQGPRSPTSSPSRWSGPTTDPATGAVRYSFDEDHIGDLMKAGFKIKVNK